MRLSEKQLFPVLALLLIGLAGSSAHLEGAAAASPTGGLFPAVVARVNGEEVPGRELELEVRRELGAIGNPEWKDLRREYRGELVLGILTALVNARLIQQEAAAAGIRVSEAEVAAEMGKFRKSFRDDAEMDAALARQNLDRAAEEKKLRQNRITAKYLEEAVHKKVVVTEAEVQEYFSAHPEELEHPEIVRTRHILIRVEGDAPQQDASARKIAEGLLARVSRGEDFALLAAEHSMDTSASQGGDLGYSTRQSLVPEYSEAAFSLPVGAPGLVRSRQGYHVIEVTDRRPEGLFTLEDVRPQLLQRMRNQKARKELEALIARLRERGEIEILLSARELLNP